MQIDVSTLFIIFLSTHDRDQLIAVWMAVDLADKLVQTNLVGLLAEVFAQAVRHQIHQERCGWDGR